MVSTDRALFDPQSAVAKRTVALGSLLENLHVIVFAKKELNLTVAKLGAHITVYPTNSSSRLGYIRDAVALGRLSGGASIVTAQDPFETGLAALKISRELNAPLQLQIHTDLTAPAFRKESFLNRIRVWIARYTIPKATCVRAVSSRIVEGIAPLLLDKTSRPTIIPIFADVGNVIAASPSSLKTAHPEFTFTIVMVSRLTKEKNIDLGLQVVANLIPQYPGLGLIIIGDGPEKKHLERKARSLGIGKHVLFMGWMNDPSPLMKASSLFLFTSSYEGYGLALVEAAAARLPIVTTNVGLVGDLLKDTVHCLACPVGDAECLTNQVTRYMRDNDLRMRHAVAASEAVMPLAEKTVAEYAKEIKDTLATCVLERTEPAASATGKTS